MMPLPRRRVSHAMKSTQLGPHTPNALVLRSCRSSICPCLSLTVCHSVCLHAVLWQLFPIACKCPDRTLESVSALLVKGIATLGYKPSGTHWEHLIMHKIEYSGFWFEAVMTYQRVSSISLFHECNLLSSPIAHHWQWCCHAGRAPASSNGRGWLDSQKEVSKKKISNEI